MPSKTIVAIIAVFLLLLTALLKGIDGAALSAGIAVIAGLGGYVAGKAIKK